MEELVEFEGLLVPVSYAKANSENKAKVCNGCGTEGWKGKLVPDTMWGLCVTPACQVHDWCYELGTTEKDKRYSDALMLINMIWIIVAEGGWLMLPRCYRAIHYYIAVVKAGHDAFWNGKDKHE